MDCSSHCSSTLASVSEDLCKFLSYPVFAAPDLNSPCVTSSCYSNGNKRKWNAVNEPTKLKDGSSPFLGLSRSSSFCTAICSGKEIEESSIDLGLSININLGDDRTSNPTKLPAGAPNTLEGRKPKLDLQLSLSTGPSESDVTTVTQVFSPYHNNSESRSLAATFQVVDEGSTSSRWKTGPLVSPLQNIKTSIPLDQVHYQDNPTSTTLNVALTSETTPISVAGASGSVNKQQHRRTGVKTCRFKGCIKGARGSSGLCIAHGGGRRCQREGCQKGAEGRTVFCKAHGGGRRCQYLGCTKSAEGGTEYCIGHGGGRRCSHEGCARAARGKSGLCIRHGGGKRCMMENCSKSAEGISGLCISHGGGRRCQYPACTKGAQGSTMFCKAHGGGRRCTFLGCTKGAEGSTLLCKGHGGGKRCTSVGCTKSVHGGTLFCVSHGGGKRCAMPQCTKSARGRTNYCVRHGGGKRCKFEGCTKSAQGSTEFCKAHGGGKRCSWGQLGSEFGGQGAIPCDKFARGKSGLCVAHSAQIQDKQMHESVPIVSTVQDLHPGTFSQLKGFSAAGSHLSDRVGTWIDSMGYGQQMIATQIPPQATSFHGNTSLNDFSLPEGRVHGGSLMAMLRGSTSLGTSNNNPEVGQNLEPVKSYPMPHSWV
ncbi:Hypothetical predicted protein [Olea europaea subsp. europaea]|uniref:WRKY19-like zinc finger domain-containing protein n=1 Tax=Olea europaea subsp. europaea TaxID=158383 RepID=A0A8S0U8I2_OLEEU|nr:Hypothetical predicted protein [Olea europaea subsp. europaea]